MEFYRYTCTPSEVGINFSLKTYPLLRETPDGYWIGPEYLKRWVSKTSLKRFAYPTKEQALKNYILRSEKRIRILKSQLRHTKLGISKAKDIKL